MRVYVWFKKSLYDKVSLFANEHWLSIQESIRSIVAINLNSSPTPIVNTPVVKNPPVVKTPPVIDKCFVYSDNIDKKYKIIMNEEWKIILNTDPYSNDCLDSINNLLSKLSIINLIQLIVDNLYFDDPWITLPKDKNFIIDYVFWFEYIKNSMNSIPKWAYILFWNPDSKHKRTKILLS